MVGFAVMMTLDVALGQRPGSIVVWLAYKGLKAW